MKIVADTNVLVRAAVRDDPKQSRIAAECLRNAETIAVTSAALCEVVWVLRKVYRFRNDEVAAAIRALLSAANVTTNRTAVEAGLAMLDAGADFADGVIAHEGRWLGGETSVSFDKDAVEMLAGQGYLAKVP